ncbi:uncharacterized protein DS421_18g630090 [Arachis hypogaea]|nr:uncharacterized protein DS421_18g630090 [Arachis hypogaea]
MHLLAVFLHLLLQPIELLQLLRQVRADNNACKKVSIPLLIVLCLLVKLLCWLLYLLPQVNNFLGISWDGGRGRRRGSHQHRGADATSEE